MRTEIRNNGIKDLTILIPDEGKVLRRIGTQDIFEGEFALGYSYYIGGIKQDPPHLDTPEDFEEIDNDDIELTAQKALEIITGQ